jgi:hypothetical protein
MIASPLLLTVGSALLVGIYKIDAAEQLAAFADHRGRAIAAVNFAIAGTVVAALAIVGLSAAVGQLQPRLGRLGGALTLIGLFGPAFFLGANSLAIELTDIGDRAAAARALEDAATTPTIVNLAGPALLVGLIVLAVGASRSGVLSRGGSWALGLTALAPVGLISGVIVIAILAWLSMAVALVPLGIRNLRDGAPLSTSDLQGARAAT